ncbi:MAG: transcription elongation factor GreA [Holosporales bacterium]
MEKIPMTLKGYERLHTELKHLKSVERPAVIRAIAEAREHGDLSENAEYAAAREKQSFIEGRIEELDAKTSRADVIDPKKLSGDKAVFGAHVTVADEDTEQEITYQLVGVDEADIHQGRLSITAPLGKALIGKKKGDSVEVRTPGGVKAYAVLKIAFLG